MGVSALCLSFCVRGGSEYHGDQKRGGDANSYGRDVASSVEYGADRNNGREYKAVNLRLVELALQAGLHIIKERQVLYGLDALLICGFDLINPARFH